MSGFCYAVKNQSMPGMMKIGLTVNLESRLKTLFNSSVPHPFELVAFRESLFYVELEKHIHLALDGCRVNERREFFNCTKRDFLEACDSFAPKIQPKPFDPIIIEAPKDVKEIFTGEVFWSNHHIRIDNRVYDDPDRGILALLKVIQANRNNILPKIIAKVGSIETHNIIINMDYDLAKFISSNTSGVEIEYSGLDYNFTRSNVDPMYWRPMAEV